MCRRPAALPLPIVALPPLALPLSLKPSCFSPSLHHNCLEFVSRRRAMNRIAILSVFALFALPALPSAILRAQESDRTASAAAPGAVNADARIKTLEDEVRSLAEQLALLRGELTT